MRDRVAKNKNEKDTSVRNIIYIWGEIIWGQKCRHMDEDDVAAEASVDAMCVAQNCRNLVAGSD
jgi:hypothetical protein